MWKKCPQWIFLTFEPLQPKGLRQMQHTSEVSLRFVSSSPVGFSKLSSISLPISHSLAHSSAVCEGQNEDMTQFISFIHSFSLKRSLTSQNS